jgi:L-rhamnose mutarotase
MSQRICFELHVRPELVDEYARRHADVWPEMRAALTETGWRNYSLFLTADGTLIGYFECDDLAAAQAAMAATEVNTRWQREMSYFFVDLGDATPDEGIVAIREVFHLD